MVVKIRNFIKQEVKRNDLPGRWYHIRRPCKCQC
jgi:hypothetical protein